MARYDIYSVRNAPYDYLLDVQANILCDLKTRVVIPLVKADLYKPEEIQRLKPTIKLDTGNYILMTADISTVEVQYLNDPICNIEQDYRDDITNALDFLFQGF